MSQRRPAKEPAPALAGTLDRIRKGRAGNEALESLFGVANGPDGATTDSTTTDSTTTEAAAAPTAAGTGTADSAPGARAGDPGTDMTSSTQGDSAGDPGAERDGAGRVERAAPSLPAAAPADLPRRRSRSHETRRSKDPSTPTGDDRTTTGGSASVSRRRPSGVPFTVLLDRSLRSKVHAWMLDETRRRQRPSNSELLVAAAGRWAPERAEEFLDWFDTYEPIGMGTPDASRFSARLDPDLVAAMELACAELTVDHDLRVPRQALMMFLLSEELDGRIQTLPG